MTSRINKRFVLLYKYFRPGALVCLSIPNRHGELPVELARKRNHDQLHQVLSDDNTVERYKLPVPETVELGTNICTRLYTVQIIQYNTVYALSKTFGGI